MRARVRVRVRARVRVRVKVTHHLLTRVKKNKERG